MEQQLIEILVTDETGPVRLQCHNGVFNTKKVEEVRYQPNLSFAPPKPHPISLGLASNKSIGETA